MMEAEDKLMVLFGHLNDRDSHQRRLREFKSPAPIVLKETYQLILLFRGGKRRPVMELERQRNSTVGDLVWLLQVFPLHGRTQCVVAGCDVLPRVTELRYVQLSTQGTIDLLEVNGRLGLAKGVKQQPLLQG